MSIVETPAPGWKAKHERALKLINEVKALNAAGTEGQTGVDEGQKSEEVTKKMAEATRLAEEVKSFKRAEQTEADLLEMVEVEDDGTTKGTVTGSSTKERQVAKKEVADFRGDRVELTHKAAERMGFDTKALTEGTASAGGYLVPPQWLQELFAGVRRQGNAFRRYGWLNVHQVNTNQVLIPKGSGSASVGWVAENATKPTADQTFGQITVNVFTAAGISKLSKQLVDDSNPAATELAIQELGALLGILEEQAILYGTGTAQPRGILNTTGVNAVDLGTATAQAIVDGILDAIVAIQTNYFGAPNGVLLHPRRLAMLQKGKDTTNQYLFNPVSGMGSERGPGGGAGLNADEPQWNLLGLPLGISANLPTNVDTAGVVGGGTGAATRDLIVVADFNEAHLFQRQEQTLDVSDIAGTAFESNQVWYRMEERLGFTAERYPKAFAVCTGAGLVP